jgi:hypothetical protein
VLYRFAWSLKCGDEQGSPLWPPALTALARTDSSPNSTTATKLLPVVPYIFLVWKVRAPKDASEPHRAEVKPTGMLGPASSNGCTMSPVRRWKRLISPHGVFQVPKSLSAIDRRRQRLEQQPGAALVAT